MILVVVEHDAGAIATTSLEALTFARALDAEVHGVAFGDGGEAALETAGEFGVRMGTHISIEGGYAPAAWAQVIVDLVASSSPSAVVAAATDRGQELLAHVGARSSAPFVANCVAAEQGADGWSVTRHRWGGSLLEDALVRAPFAVLSVALAVVAPDAAGEPAAVTIDELTPSASADDLRARATRVDAPGGGARSLTDARLVVGGGRGVGSAEGFASIDALADALGGVVGVSRAVTSAGWRSHAQQIGQTGERIAPELYIACGISGASQHMVGCRGAKKLLVINSDPDAPILAQADYAVIGDLHQVVPAITAEFERRRG
ncbi:MAG: electron transfer flavoprotein subunit alpha/FixB family protein [Actinomycetota bacterium]|nr:electron transfer flavoprotein subunit alpha/FixB family protein [Actinomycetota bacterium]MDH5225333.1 electron transfer flavoprotein subunit alpha/FixB family protein [Actinomycetota bacterium]MDH5314432.1 electron transfer flavoprotein subunit alpha/FixB family protein [Actinomycetota bacterium]